MTGARSVDRRSFFKTLGMTAGAAMALTGEAAAEASANVVQSNVKRASEPSKLQITDLRVAVVAKAPMTCPLIRIDTNQGLTGYGEVRDGASETYALMLKSRILGENPCNVDKIFRKIKQFGHHARQAGGVCGIEMAMMDLAGKAWGVPCWQMLGGKFRDRVRLYADTTEAPDAKAQGEKLKARMDLGITYLKQDFGINLLQKIPGSTQHAGGLHLPSEPGRDAPVHRDRDHRQGHCVPRRLHRADPAGDRPRDPAFVGSLRAHRRQQLHQARARDGEAHAGVDGRHGAVAARSPDEADQGQHDHTHPDRRGHLLEGGLRQTDRHGSRGHDSP